MVRINGVSSYPWLELSGSNCFENSTPKPREKEIWFELCGVRVNEVTLYNCGDFDQPPRGRPWRSTREMLATRYCWPCR